jgi:hypothetical protein
MPQVLNKRPPKAPERSQTPLWFVAIGLAIALLSRGVEDEIIANLVFWFGVVFSIVAALYWIFHPKHGVPS